jgi:hypothetical protein
MQSYRPNCRSLHWLRHIGELLAHPQGFLHKVQLRAVCEARLDEDVGCTFRVM